MLAIDVLSRVLHVMTAITLVGGSVFMLFVLHPVISKLESESKSTIQSDVIGRWKRFIHFGVLVFLASGFYNYIRAIPLHRGDGLYHALIGTKIILALVIFFVASALVGRSPKLQFMRDNRAKWLKLIVLFSAVIVSFSGFVKVRGIPESPTEKTSTEVE